MSNQSFDLPRGYSLLNKLDGLTYLGRPVSEWKIGGNFNAWQAYRQRIFYGDIKRFLIQSEAASGVKAGSKGKDLLGYFLAGLISGGALLKDFFLPPRVIVYSIDKVSSPVAQNDQRLNFLYQFLTKYLVPYREFFHSWLGRTLFINSWHRRRLAVYLLILDWFYLFQSSPDIEVNDQDLGGTFDLLSAAEKKWAKDLMAKYQKMILKSNWQINQLVKILTFLQPQAIWGIDNPRDYQELVIAAKLAKIPFYAFQHGHITKYHIGWLTKPEWVGELATPDYLYVWSDYWRDELKRLGSAFTPQQVVVGGLKETVEPPQGELVVGEKINVLIPFETEADPAIVKNYIDQMLTDENITVYFKLRPDVAVESQLTQSHLTPNYHPRLVATTDLKSIINQINVVAGTYSTFLYDMASYYKPIVLLQTPSDFGEGLVVNGLATMVSLNQSLAQDLRSAASTPSQILRDRCQKLNGSGRLLMEQTLETLAKELKII